eukprot:GILJ01001615.1.p1 GENE.GILJ01001615.1~~GILJ01001615.1.p1  ORF type:complete len:270 (+),score=41.09 GILJ01001615.1:45-812(+)
MASPHHAVSDGSMSVDDKKRLQAMLGNVKKQNTKAYASQKNVVGAVTEDDVDVKDTLVFSGCDDSEYSVDGRCTKVVVMNCNNFKLRLNGTVLTHILEFYKCNNCTFSVNTQIATVQADMSKTILLEYERKSDFTQLVWAGVHDMTLRIRDVDQSVFCHFPEQEAQDASVVEERSQWIVRFVLDRLLQEKVVRLPNGFTTTLREKREYDEKQEASVQAWAKEAGITIHRKKKEEIGRNDPCTCGSGKKFKKCCGV